MKLKLIDRVTDAYYFPTPMITYYGKDLNIDTEHYSVKTRKFTHPHDSIDMMRGGIIPGYYITLNRKNDNGSRTVVMSDTPMERYTNQHFIDAAYGNILIIGLGIGMVIPPLADKLLDEELESITIIEKDKELIDIFEPLIREKILNDETNPKVKIINDDGYTYAKNHTNEHYDFIYIDIWDDYIGFKDELDTFDAIMDDYRKISDNVDAWGYLNAIDGRDEIPTEHTEYARYLANMIAEYKYAKLIDKEIWDNIVDYVTECSC